MLPSSNLRLSAGKGRLSRKSAPKVKSCRPGARMSDGPGATGVTASPAKSCAVGSVLYAGKAPCAVFPATTPGTAATSSGIVLVVRCLRTTTPAPVATTEVVTGMVDWLECVHRGTLVLSKVTASLSGGCTAAAAPVVDMVAVRPSAVRACAGPDAPTITVAHRIGAKAAPSLLQTNPPTSQEYTGSRDAREQNS